MIQPQLDSPELSIVIATSHSSDALKRCLAELERQIANRAVEIIVATDSADEARLARALTARVNLVEEDHARLVPELWGLAATRARGRVMALTTASFIPGPHWIDTILRSMCDGCAAVGGAVENMPGSMLDWAVYFVRYSAFMPPFRAGPVPHVLGDNAAYLRDAIAPRMDWIRVRGFWEAEINAWLVAQGRTLMAEPRMVMQYANAFSLGGFARQRLEHGRIFGRMRAAKSTPARRALYIVTSPAIPLIYLSRIFRNVFNKRRNRVKCLLSLPLIVFFLVCWTLGEFLGLVFG